MMLHNPISWLKRAQELGVAVPALNIHNLEVLQGALLAAADERSPVIIQTSPGSLKYMGLPYVVAAVKAGAESLGVPVALQMDHCVEFETIIQCIRAGYTSVMVETGHLSYKDNVALMRKVVEIAHSVGVMVEGELGRIGGTEDHLTVNERDATFTVPEEARDYVDRTGIDILAVAIGTAHGVYKGEPKLDFDRLQAIRERVALPLVLHGASGVPEASIKKSLTLGISKINIATDLKTPLAAAIKEVFAFEPDEEDPRVYMGAGREAVRKMAREKIQLFGAAGLLDRL